MPNLNSLLARAYGAKVLRRGHYQEVVQDLRSALKEDSAMAAEAVKKRADLTDLATRVGNLRERDFVGSVNLQTLIDAIGGGL